MFEAPPDDLPFLTQELSGHGTLCNSSRIVFSPSGDYVALWSDRDDPALAQTSSGGALFVRLAETACLMSGEADCRVWQLGSPSTFNGVFWSPADQLVIVPPDQPIRVFAPARGEVTDVISQSRWRDWSKFRISGLIDADRLTLINDWPRIEANWRIGQVSGWRGNFYGVALDRTDHTLALVDGLGGAVPGFRRLSLSAHWVGENAAWAHDGEGRAYLVGGGAFHRIDSGHLSRIMPQLVRPEGVWEAATGDLLGGFDDDEIALFDGRSTRPVPAGLDFYTSVSIHRERGLHGSIWKSVDGGHHIRLEANDGPGFTIDCLRASDRPIHAAWTESWGTDERPLHVRRTRLRDGSRGTAVIFRGGPGGTIARGGAAGGEGAWLKRGYDTVTVEATGADGPELFGRLRSDGVDALKGDAMVVAHRLATELAPTDVVVVEGTSFGAIAASETAAELDRLRSEGRTGLVLYVPWFVHRDPGEVRHGYGPAPLSAEFARLSETSRFGPMRAGGDGFADQMDRWRRTFRWDGATLAIFGEGDSLSTPRDLWSEAEAMTALEVRTYPGGHRFAGLSTVAESEIRSWLTELQRAN